MPFIYVRGFLAHVGKVFEGLNPVNIMSDIVRRTELNMNLSDLVYPENAPAPTWLYLRDSKRNLRRLDAPQHVRLSERAYSHSDS